MSSLRWSVFHHCPCSWQLRVTRYGETAPEDDYAADKLSAGDDDAAVVSDTRSVAGLSANARYIPDALELSASGDNVIEARVQITPFEKSGWIIDHPARP